jgi:cytochrome c oxidase subunit 2
MTAHRIGTRWWQRLMALLPVLLTAPFLAGCTLEEFPQSTLHPQADYAHTIHNILTLQTTWVVIIFAIVQVLLIVAVVRFRNRPGAPDPKPVHGNTVLEIAWTIAPAIILTIVAVPTVIAIYETQADPPEGSLHVTVVGHQWWWEFQYPEEGIVTATDMVVPLGRTIAVDIKTADVLHSFWFPAMGGKRDAVGGRTNRMWFTPERTGEFPGQCAELCGTSHANMRSVHRVVTPAEADAWVAKHRAGPARPDSGTIEAEGLAIYRTSACIACHRVEGISPGVLGPDLTHVGSRSTLAGGMFPNTAEAMEAWILNAPARKPGAKMLTFDEMKMKPEQVKPLVAYLQSLK